MEQTLNHGMCRCCASEGMFKNFSATYQWMGADEVYADMLKECFDISLTTADDWNNGGICEVCITQLRNASNFRKQVLQTEDQFKKALQDKLYKDSIVKVEVNRDEDDLDSDNNVSDFSGTGELEFEVPVKEELEETKTKKRTAKATTSRAKKAKTEDGEPSSKRRNPIVRAKKNNRLIQIEIPPEPKKKIKLIKRKNADSDKHQHNIKEILLYSNATPIHRKVSFGYTCCFCTSCYENPADLKQHTIKDHDDETKTNYLKGSPMVNFVVKLDITDLKCTLCDANIREIEDLINHLITKHNRQLHSDIKSHLVPFRFGDGLLRCVYCSKETNNFKVLLEHMNLHCNNYVCHVCGASFVTKRTLMTHSYRHQTGVFNCDFCAKEFDTHVKKKAHERAVHICSSQRSKCGFCGEKFSDYVIKNKHEAKVHGAKRLVLKCQTCDKSFDNQRSLTVHNKIHFNEPFNKDLCNNRTQVKRVWVE